MGTIGDRFRELRQEHGLSQSSLGVKVGCAQTTIANYESGRNKGETIIPRIAQYFGVEALWLAEGVGPKYRLQVPGPAEVDWPQPLIPPPTTLQLAERTGPLYQVAAPSVLPGTQYREANASLRTLTDRLAAYDNAVVAGICQLVELTLNLVDRHDPPGDA